MVYGNDTRCGHDLFPTWMVKGLKDTREKSEAGVSGLEGPSTIRNEI